MQAEGRRVAVVIEDDDDIRHLLETVLAQAGFDVAARSNGYDGIEAVRTLNPEVITLDVNMPGMDGFETAKRIRAFSNAYIVMLTALGEEIDTLQGLEAGADDYITKPFRPRELRARIEAMMRRPRGALGAPPISGPPTAAPQSVAPPASPVLTPPPMSPPTGGPGVPMSPTPPPQRPHEPPSYTAVAPTPEPLPGERLQHLGLVIDLGTRVVVVENQEIPLTRSEFDLLAALLQSGRRVRTKADLAILLRNESYVTNNFVSDADKRGIEVHMGNLRKKIGENSLTPRWIETVRGVGYRLTAGDGSV
ncbi:MAG: response regulator [Pseudolysinimonas sp.]|uniref:response regulator transcription factor n=1 Tax=Pseudolysinimonas sp. TaxID=2680009 RepID=UPI003264A5A9